MGILLWLLLSLQVTAGRAFEHNAFSVHSVGVGQAVALADKAYASAGKPTEEDSGVKSWDRGRISKGYQWNEKGVVWCAWGQELVYENKPLLGKGATMAQAKAVLGDPKREVPDDSRGHLMVWTLPNWGKDQDLKITFDPEIGGAFLFQLTDWSLE